MPPDPDKPTTTTRTKKAKKRQAKQPEPTPDPTGELIARLLTGPVTHDGQPARVIAVGGGKDQPLTALLQDGDHTRSVPATELHTPAPAAPPPAEEERSAPEAQLAPTQPAGGTP